MKIHIKTKEVDLTPSFQTYIEGKLMPLAKFLKRFDEEGVLELWLEVARTTRHHHKGEVFMAKGQIRLPKSVLRAEHESTDPRAAVDLMKDTFRIEIKKYKEKYLQS